MTKNNKLLLDEHTFAHLANIGFTPLGSLRPNPRHFELVLSRTPEERKLEIIFDRNRAERPSLSCRYLAASQSRPRSLASFNSLEEIRGPKFLRTVEDIVRKAKAAKAEADRKDLAERTLEKVQKSNIHKLAGAIRDLGHDVEESRNLFFRFRVDSVTVEVFFDDGDESGTVRSVKLHGYCIGDTAFGDVETIASRVHDFLKGIERLAHRLK